MRSGLEKQSITRVEDILKKKKVKLIIFKWFMLRDYSRRYIIPRVFTRINTVKKTRLNVLCLHERKRYMLLFNSTVLYLFNFFIYNT